MNSGLILILPQMPENDLKSITLYLDDLLITCATSDNKLLVKDGSVNVADDFWRPRLVAACRLAPADFRAKLFRRTAFTRNHLR